MELEERIKKLAEIRRDVEQGSYLNPFKAKEHIAFLLILCDELAGALSAIEIAREEVVGGASTTKG